MAIILTDKDLKRGIEGFIETTQEYVFVLSPYIDLDDYVQKAFGDLKNNVIKTIIYRDSDSNGHQSGISHESRKFFKKLSNIELVSVKNLHAKLFLNENSAILSTMNLTGSSRHNFEIGVLMDRVDDFDMYNELFNYMMYIITSDYSDLNSERFQNIIPDLPFTLDLRDGKCKINGKDIEQDLFKSLHKACNVKHGYCIRCGTENLEFNPKRPLCKKCFKDWGLYKNKSYQEKVCHRCGMEEEELTINEPHCAACDAIYAFEIEKEYLRRFPSEKLSTRYSKKS